MDLTDYFKKSEPILKLFFESLVDELTYPLIEVGRRDLAKGLVNGLVVITNRIMTHPRIKNLKFNKVDFQRRGESQLYFGVKGSYFTNAEDYGGLELELQQILSLDDISSLPKHLVHFDCKNISSGIKKPEEKLDFQNDLQNRIILSYYLSNGQLRLL